MSVSTEQQVISDPSIVCNKQASSGSFWYVTCLVDAYESDERGRQKTVRVSHEVCALSEMSAHSIVLGSYDDAEVIEVEVEPTFQPASDGGTVSCA